MHKEQDLIRVNYRRSFIVGCLFFACTAGFAQSKVTGNVKDAMGDPLVGVSVVEVGTNNGTITDADGNYTLSVKPGARLKISYVGFNLKEIKAGDKTKVILEEDNKVLNEVVVVGYGTMRRKDVTSSITTIKSEDLIQMVVPASLFVVLHHSEAVPLCSHIT